MDYVTSDLHFRHNRIIIFERTQFKTVEEHDQYIIDQWNSVIQDHDRVFVLGDLGFKPFADLGKLVKQLKGHKILVKGNHDQMVVGDAINMGFEMMYDHPIYYNTHIILSHEPVKEAWDNPYVYNIHGHCHNFQTIDAPNFVNVNIATTDYKPIPMAQFVSKANLRCKSRKEKWETEWYCPYLLKKEQDSRNK